MVLDGHVMLGSGRDASLSVEQLLETMDGLGIDRAIVSPGRRASSRSGTVKGTSSSLGRLRPRAGACSRMRSPLRGSAPTLSRSSGAHTTQVPARSSSTRHCRASTSSTGRRGRSSGSRSSRAGRSTSARHAARAPAAACLAGGSVPGRSFLLGKAGATDFSHDGPATLAAAPNLYADSVYVEWPTALAATDPAGRGGPRVLLLRCPFRRPRDRARARDRGAVRTRRAGGDPRRDARAPGRPVIGLAAGDRSRRPRLRATGLAADELIDALLAAVGPTGVVVMPTFTYDNETFTLDTPGRTGTLAEVFRRRSEAIRSLHPTYSVAAVGGGAAELVDGHERARATGADSPLGRLAHGGGYVLLLGVPHTANTTAHMGEFGAERRTSTFRLIPAGRRTARRGFQAAVVPSVRSSGRCANAV